MDLNKASVSYSESTFLVEKVLTVGTCLGSLKVRLLIVFLFLLFAAIDVSAGVTLGVFLSKSDDNEVSSVRTFSTAAVATDSEACSTIGVDILKKGGSAVDAAVASSFCVGVVNLHSTGIGGGGFMIYYNATNDSSVMIDFREVAAAKITEETMAKYRDEDEATVQGVRPTYWQFYCR